MQSSVRLALTLSNDELAPTAAACTLLPLTLATLALAQQVAEPLREPCDVIGNKLTILIH